METLPLQTLNCMAQAADLRAVGLKWETVAAKLGRRLETVRRWPERYPATWQRLYRAAVRQHIGEAGTQSRTVLQSLVWHSKDDRVRASVGKYLSSLEERADVREQQCEAATGLTPEVEQEVRKMEYWNEWHFLKL